MLTPCEREKKNRYLNNSKLYLYCQYYGVYEHLNGITQRTDRVNFK